MRSTISFVDGSIRRMTPASHADCHRLSNARIGSAHGGTSPTLATTVFVAGSIRLRPTSVWWVIQIASSVTANHAADGAGIRANSAIVAGSYRRTWFAWMLAT